MITIREWVEAHFAGRHPRDVVIFELGSNRFEDTAWLARLGRVYAFDPNPMVPLRRQPEGVVFTPAAVGVVDGKVPWWQSTTRDGVRDYPKSSSVLRPTRHLEVHPEVRFAEVGIILALWRRIIVSRVTHDILFSDREAPHNMLFHRPRIIHPG